MTAQICSHAASGCNYPEGECAGLCEPVSHAVSMEREKVAITARYPASADSPGRLGLHLYSRTYGSTFQEYFDRPESLEQISDLLWALAQLMRAEQPACPPCNGNCNQGRTCPARLAKGQG